MLFHRLCSRGTLIPNTSANVVGCIQARCFNRKCELESEKCSGGQYGIENCDSLSAWIVVACPAFREVKIDRAAELHGTVIGPEGHLRRWIAPSAMFDRVCAGIRASSGSVVQKLVAFKRYALTTPCTVVLLRHPTWRPLLTTKKSNPTSHRRAIMPSPLMCFHASNWRLEINIQEVAIAVLYREWRKQWVDTSMQSSHDMITRLDRK